MRKFRALVFGIALVLLSAGLTSCSSSADDGVSQLESSASPLPERIRPIEIAQTDIAFPAPFDQEWAQGTATRIVTLANGSGEVVAVLGGGDRVVGRDETSSAPEISGAPIVTSSHEINVESVLGVTPDLVLIDASSGPQEAIDSIRSAGITVVEVPEAWTIAEIAPKVEAIGSAIGAPVEAITYVAGLTAASEQMSLAPTPKVAFLYVRGTSAIYLLGGEG
ncbi:MAG: ABC transporter substrate-binding protein, partial [Actinomycetia bacterium]|nr:ABC transporter substrate-binding protein [Actinomycetes bacterium]